jgi:hypothetical protein
MTMPKLRTLGPLVRTHNTNTTQLPSKQIDPIYNTPQFKEWRAKVIARAGARCEVMVNGHRCTKAHPEHRMYADHIIELKDGGSAFDLGNGQCVCASHHSIKTNKVRTRRLQT